MLILTHADGLGVDLDKLRQRVLQPAGDGHGGTQVDVVFGELLGGQLAGRVHRCACLTDHHITDPAAHTADELHRHLLGLTAGSAVADGNVDHLVSGDHAGQGGDGLLLLTLAVGGVDHSGVQHLAGAVHHSHLAAHAVAGVKAHGHLALNRGLHEQGTQVKRKVVDGTLAGRIGQVGADLTLQRGLEQTYVGVIGGGTHDGHGGPVGYHQTTQGDQSSLGVQLHTGLEDLFLLTAVDGQHLMALCLGEGGGKVVVQAIDAVLGLLVGGSGHQHGTLAVEVFELLAYPGVVGDHLGDNIAGTLKCFLNSIDTLFGIDIILCQNSRIPTILLKNCLGKGFQALFTGSRATGTALLLIGKIEIFHFRHGSSGQNGVCQFFRELTLIFDGFQNFFSTLLKIAKICQTGFQIAKGGIIHSAMHFLTVAGDKGDGIAFVHQCNHIFYVFLLLSQFLSQNFYDCLHGNFPCFSFGGYHTIFFPKREVKNPRMEAWVFSLVF